MSELGPYPNSRVLLTPKVFTKLGYCFVKEYNALDRLKPDSQVSSIQSLSCVRLFATPWTAAGHASLSIPTPGVYSDSCPLSRWYHPTISSSVVSFSFCLQSFPASGSFPTSQFFASDGQCIGVSTSNEYSGLISFRMDWLDPLSVQGTLKSLLQHHSSKASILLHLAFFMVQLSHPYMTTGTTIALTRWTFVYILFKYIAISYCDKYYEGKLWNIMKA